MFELSVKYVDDCLMKVGGEKILCHAVGAKRECVKGIDLSVTIIDTRRTKGCKVKHKEGRLELLAGSPVVLGIG